MGHTDLGHTATLTILGKPVMFAMPELCRVEGCLNPLHKGPCKGSKRKIGSSPAKAAPKKKGAAKKAVAKKAAPAEVPDDIREGEVKRMTSRDAHQGVPMKTVIGMFEEAGKLPGWSFDRKLMRATFKDGKGGTGVVEMVPGGYRTVTQRAGGQGLQVKTYRDIGTAFADIRPRLLLR